MTTKVWYGLAAAALLVSGSALGAQARLDGRLDNRTRAAIVAILDSAAAQGLPVEPLESRALEGASRNIEGTRIVGAVRAMWQRMTRARAILGTAPVGDLVAGTVALQAGVPADALARLRMNRPHTALAVPLVVMADLVSRGVAADTAAGLILRLASQNASDESFLALRMDVARDVLAGAQPVDAASIRTRGVLTTLPPVAPGATANVAGTKNSPNNRP